MTDINSTQLAMFFASPDAAQIVAIFNKLEGPIRDSVISHAALLASHTIIDPRVEELVSAPPMIEHRPLLSTSLEGRVDERKLRGEKVKDIAKAEGITSAEVQKILEHAADERRIAAGKPPKAKKAAAEPKKQIAEAVTGSTRTERREEAVRLRMFGYAPSTIAKRMGVSSNLVSNVLYEARVKYSGPEYPPINDKEAAVLEAAAKLQQPEMVAA